MNRIILLFTLLLFSTALFGQANPAKHAKRKTGVAADNSGPSLKETVAWIAEKLNNYGTWHGSEDVYRANYTGDTAFIAYKYGETFRCENTKDSVKNLTYTFSFHCYITKIVGKNLVTPEEDPQKNGYRYQTNYIPLDDIDEVKIINANDIHYRGERGSKLLFPGSAKMLQIFLYDNSKVKVITTPAGAGAFLNENGAYDIWLDGETMEADMPERMIKAFHHLKAFYSHPKVKPKAKEAF